MSHLICKTTNLYDCTHGSKNPWVIYTSRMGVVVNAVNICSCKNRKKNFHAFLNGFKNTAILGA